ncbi:ParB N-terminal domain-containing protein [Persicobacter diffluens]|uniref:ParB-like N-terminal domain-containing protein n=1 Tax=Persicobacter diffluens TaxID=981 RepID=A0AAN5AMF0_9BACT|nr:hypothetical protein PEDI_55570 [Persicobacter diffluens]
MSLMSNVIREMREQEEQQKRKDRHPPIISVLNELRDLIRPLTEEEKNKLYDSIKKDGVRDPIIFWKHDDQHIIIDGHNRYEAICKLGIKTFPWVEKHFNSLEEAKDWMIMNQFSRRNLNSKQMKYYRGLLYNRMKSNNGGIRKGKNFSGKNLPTDTRTSAVLAQSQGISEKTIRNDGLFQIGLDLLDSQEPGTKQAVLNGTKKISDKRIQELALGKIELSLTERKPQITPKKLEAAVELILRAKEENLIQPELWEKIRS